jgi:hypothetical protein
MAGVDSEGNNVCTILVQRGTDNNSYTFGQPILKSLYQVYHYESNEISFFIHTYSTATSSEGGVEFREIEGGLPGYAIALIVIGVVLVIVIIVVIVCCRRRRNARLAKALN